MKTTWRGRAAGRAVLAAAVWALGGASGRGDWVRLEAGAAAVSAKAPPRAERVGGLRTGDITRTNLTLAARLPGFFRDKHTDEDGAACQIVWVPGASRPQPGHPDVPVLSRWILIPNGVDTALRVSPGRPVVFEGVALPPVRPDLPDTGSADLPLARDAAIYGRDADYPPAFAELERVRVRGQDAGILRVHPFRYNPVRKRLTVYPELSVEVAFDGEPAPRDRRLAHGGTATALRRLAPNADVVLKAEEEAADFVAAAPAPADAVRPRGVVYGGSNGCDLLIITPPAFTNAAAFLADWKSRRGLVSRVATTNETGATPQSIWNYIHAAYTGWDPAPAYVLLIGDAEFIPAWYKREHPKGGLTGTDFYYADMDSPANFIADLAVGRWPVDTLQQAMRCAWRVVAYERDPPDPQQYARFYTRSVQAAAFQDGDDGVPPDRYADRRFAKTTEDLHEFLEWAGYASTRVYAEYNGYNASAIFPSNWTQDWDYLFENDTRGAPLPADLLKPGFAWDGTGADVSAAVNAGAFLVTHRDHGGRDGWSQPHFREDDVDALANGTRRPVVYSLSCQTGWFDNETDEQSWTGAGDECFAEHWMRHPSGGAAGVIAASRTSYSGHNDRLTWGLMEAVWPSFLAFHGDSFAGDQDPIYRMGDVLNFGRKYYRSRYGLNATVKTQFEIYHWFGDPTLEIWTAPPADLNVACPGGIVVGSTSIEVSITQEQAFVCCRVDGTILGTAWSSGGVARVALDPPPGAMGYLDVTVTKHDHRPHLATLKVWSPAGTFWPEVETDPAVSNVTRTSAACGGTVTDTGNTNVFLRGVCWAEAPNPTRAEACTTNGTGGGRFASELTGLRAGRDYHVRAYAENAEGLSYGDEVVFTTTYLLEATESFEKGLGVWSQSAADEIDWRRGTQTTPSSDTGPAGASDGDYYLYIEASSHLNERACLEATFDFSGVPGPLLAFDYHMHGLDMGSLYVDVYDGVSWDLGVWFASGQQHESASAPWTRVEVSLAAYGGRGPVVLRFRGVTGPGYRSDMAIDNVVVRDSVVSLTVTNGWGMGDPPDGVYSHSADTEVTCRLTTAALISGQTQYVCTGWSGTGSVLDGTGTNVTFTISNDTTLTWLWRTNYWLSVRAGPHGSIRAGSNGWYLAGSAAAVEAAPQLYYHFTRWTGSSVSASNPLSLAMDCPQELTANFGANLAARQTPEWWLVAHGWASNFTDAALADPDGDGMETWGEWHADTDPTNGNSVLAVTGTRVGPGDVTIEWTGGVLATQYVERADGLAAPTGTLWAIVATNLPPTHATSNRVDWSELGDSLFFRVRVPFRSSP